MLCINTLLKTAYLLADVIDELRKTMPVTLQSVNFDYPQIIEGADAELTIELDTSAPFDPLSSNTVYLNWTVGNAPVTSALLTKRDNTALPATVTFTGSRYVIELTSHSVGNALRKVVTATASLEDATHPNRIKKVDTLAILKTPDSSPRNEDATQLDPLLLDTFITAFDLAIKSKQQPISVTAVPESATITTADALTLAISVDRDAPSTRGQTYFVAIDFTVQQADGFAIVPFEDFFKGNPSKPYYFLLRKGETAYYSLHPKELTGVYIVNFTVTLQVGTTAINKRYYYDTATIEVTGV